MNTKEAKRQIGYWRGHLRLLADWRINFDDKAECKGQSFHSGEAKWGIICDLPGWWDKDGKPISGTPDDYIFHEMLHICMAEVRAARNHKEKKKREEILVQDLCRIVSEGVTLPIP